MQMVNETFLIMKLNDEDHWPHLRMRAEVKIKLVYLLGRLLGRGVTPRTASPHPRGQAKVTQ